MNWKIEKSQVVLQDRWINVRADRCKMPDGKIVTPYYVLQYPNWANALALTKENQVILIEQYRHGMGEVILELPGGNIDENEAPMEAIKRELLEETGYAFEQIIPTAVLSPNPANHSNRSYSFLALGGIKVQAQELDHYEAINVKLVSIETLEAIVEANQFPQAMHVSSVYYGLKKLKSLVRP